MQRQTPSQSPDRRASAPGKPAYEARHAMTPVNRPVELKHRGPVGVAVAVASAAVVTTMVVGPAGSSPTAAATRHDGASEQRTSRAQDQIVSRQDIDTVDASQPLGIRTGGTHTTLDARSTRQTATRKKTKKTTRTTAGGTKTLSASPLTSDGIPATALSAYRSAARAMTSYAPGCQIPWPLIAGIGRVESDHGRFGGAVLRTDGTSSIKIFGPVLDGHGTAVITDTDGGALDGNSVYDRAMGPMQFIPSTWASYASDGNGDGVDDPFNIYDAAQATAKYLCVAGGNLSTTAGQERAVFSYNHLDSYVSEVIGLERAYAAGAGVVVPDGDVTTTGSTGQSSSATGGSASPVRAHNPRRKHTTLRRKLPRSTAKPVRPSKPKSTAPAPTKPPSTTPTPPTPPKSTAPTKPPSTTPTPPKSTAPAPTKPPSTAPTPPKSTPPASTGSTLTCPVGSHPAGTAPATVSDSTVSGSVAAQSVASGSQAGAAQSTALPKGCVLDTETAGSTGTLQG